MQSGDTDSILFPGDVLSVHSRLGTDNTVLDFGCDNPLTLSNTTDWDALADRSTISTQTDPDGQLQTC